MGSKSGGNKFTQTVGNQTSAPAPAAQQAITSELQRVQDVQNLPYTAYSGPLVAGFTPQQQQAFGQVGNLQGIAQPYINQATGMTLGAANSLAPQNWAQTVQSYMNPFAQNVIDPALANLRETFGQQFNNLKGNAIAGGGYSPQLIPGQSAGRYDVAGAELAREQALAQGATISPLLEQMYGQATNQANTAAQTGLQGAGQIGNLGQLALNTGLTGTNALLQSGALQQAQQQALNSTGYQQFLQAQGFPYAQTGWGASLIAGLSPELGGTTAGTQFQGVPQPSSMAQNVGLGIAGLSALGGMKNPFGSLSSGISSLFGGSGFNAGDTAYTNANQSRGGRVKRQDGGELDLPETKGGEGGGSIVPEPPVIAPKTNFPNLDLSSHGRGSSSSGSSGSGILGDIAAGAKLAATIIPMLEKGGRVDRADGGMMSPMPMGLMDALGGLPINLLAQGKDIGVSPPSQPFGSTGQPFSTGVSLGYVGQPPNIKGAANFPKLNLKSSEGKVPTLGGTIQQTMSEVNKPGGLDISKLFGKPGGSTPIDTSSSDGGSASGGRMHYDGGGKDTEAGSRGDMARFFLDQNKTEEPSASVPLDEQSSSLTVPLPPHRPRGLGAINIPLPPRRPEMIPPTYEPSGGVMPPPAYDPGGGLVLNNPYTQPQTTGLIPPQSPIDWFFGTTPAYAEGGRTHFDAGGVDTSGLGAIDAAAPQLSGPPTPFDPLFIKYGQKYGIPPNVLKGQARVETRFDPNADNGIAQGLMQFKPSTAKSYGIDPFDPEQAVEGAARFMGRNMAKYGNLNTALMAYHGGDDQSQWGPRTQAYPGLVLGTGSNAPAPGLGNVGPNSQSMQNIQGLLGNILHPTGLNIPDPNAVPPGAFLSPAAAQGLMAFGLGMAASPARTIGQAAGQGGLEGLRTYQNVINQQRQNQLLQTQQQNIASEIAGRAAERALPLIVQQRAAEMQLEDLRLRAGIKGPSPGTAPNLTAPVTPISSTTGAPVTLTPGQPSTAPTIPAQQSQGLGDPIQVPQTEDAKRYDDFNKQAQVERDISTNHFTQLDQAGGQEHLKNAMEYQKSANDLGAAYRKQNMDVQNQLSTAFNSAQHIRADAIQHLANIKDQNGNYIVNTGPIGAELTAFGGLLRQLGVSDDIVKKWTGNVPEVAQQLENNATQMIGGIMRENLGPGQRFTQAEFRTIAAANPGLKLLPATIEYVIRNGILPRAQYDIDRYVNVRDRDPGNPGNNVQQIDGQWAAQNPVEKYTGAAMKAYKAPAPAQKMLREHPELAPKFDQWYGPDTSKAVLDLWGGR